MLNIAKTLEDKKATLALEGRLDTTTAPELETVVKEILPDITELTLDFEKLEYISSAGLRVLLSAEKAMMAAGGMKLRNVGQSIMEILEVTGFSDFLTIEGADA